MKKSLPRLSALAPLLVVTAATAVSAQAVRSDKVEASPSLAAQPAATDAEAGDRILRQVATQLDRRASVIAAIGYAVAGVAFLMGLLLATWIGLKKLRKSGLLAHLRQWFTPRPKATVIEFYERMVDLLADRGLVRSPHQTPLEFALSSGLSPIREITNLYNRVRFGGIQLDDNETRRVSELLVELKQKIRTRN